MSNQPVVVFEPGGYARFAGQSVPERERLQALTWLFAVMLLRGWRAKLRIAAFVAPALGFAIYTYVRTILPQFAVPAAEEGPFLLKNLSYIFAINVVQLLITQAGQTAPLLARDAHAGALLLYFSRPLLRPQYLLARWLSTGGLAAVLLAGPVLVYLLTHGATLGFAVQGTALTGKAEYLVLPALALLVTVASVLMAGMSSLVALAAGIVTRAPATAPLLYGGGILASTALAYVLQAAVGQSGWPKALNLFEGLRGPLVLLLWPLTQGNVAKVAVAEALMGTVVWAGLTAGAWWLLQRFLRNPPLGKGRA